MRSLIIFLVFVSGIFPASTTFATPSLTQDSGSCPFLLLLTKQSHRDEVQALREVLLSKVPGVTAQKPGWAFLRKTPEGDSEIVTLGEKWFSRESSYPGTYTTQGDIRYPIALFGPELAWMLGFRARQNEEGKWIFTIPSLRRLHHFIGKVNAVLISQGRDPISYLPVSSELINADTLLNGAVAVRGPILLRFPFAENDPKLIAHEVSFHLGLILYPSKVLRRVYVLNQRTLQLANFLRKNSQDLGGKGIAIADQLVTDRALDIDFGTAETQASLASLRISSALKPYSSNELKGFADDRAVKMSQLARPEFTPTRAVVARIAEMTSLNEFRLDVLKKSAPYYYTFADDTQGLGGEIYLRDEQEIRLAQLLNEFSKIHEAEDALYPSEDTTEFGEELRQGLDARVSELLEAATAAGFVKP